MLLLPNILYQFVFASKRTPPEPDPEKGPQDASVSSPSDDNYGDGSQDMHVFSPTEESHHEVDDGATDNLEPNIDEVDDNDIVDELEHEEYPEAQPTSRKRGFSLTRTLSGKSMSFWAKCKDALDPSTSPEVLESYVPHYRYLPIFSGVIIPFSILLEIPGLTEDWYIRTENHKTVEIRKNTVILDIGLSFSIVFAALANLCLVIRFMEKKVKRMTILCILFLTIHDAINIIAVTTFGVEHRFDDGFTYGQAFWMTVCSTSVSTITNITLVVDLLRTHDFDQSGSGLTRKQRTLVISVMALLTYIGLGALVQTFLDNLTFLNALYFTVVTIETVGFGDIVPVSPGARVFACIYSIFGIINLALTVGLTRETVLEAIEVSYRRRVKAVRQRRRAARFERRVVSRWNAAIEWRLRQSGLPLWVHDSQPVDFEREIWHECRQWFHDRIWPLTSDAPRTRRYYKHVVGHTHPRGMHLNLESLSWTQLESAAMEAGVPLWMLLPEGFKPHGQTVRETERALAGTGDRSDAGEPLDDTLEKGKGKQKQKVTDQNQWFCPPTVPDGTAPLPLTHARLGRMMMMLGNFALAVDDETFAKVRKRESVAAKVQRQKASLAIKTEDKQSVDHKTRPVAEQYEALRATMVDEERKAYRPNVLTLSQGDLTPQTPAGRSVFIFWALLGIATMTILISILPVVSEAYSSRYKSIFTSGLINQAIKRYQDRAREAARERIRPRSATTTLVSTRPPDTSTTLVQPQSPFSATTLVPSFPLHKALTETEKRVTGRLESLPTEVLEHARTFGEEAKYLIEPNLELVRDRDGLPEGLGKMMDDLAGVERLGERIKEEILRDSDARHALLALSIDNVLRKIVEIAEEAVEIVRERDRLKELKDQDDDVDVGQQTGTDTGRDEDGIRLRQGFVEGDSG
ncbi:hypothetical protein H0H93_009696 [Arthromyces matolae]|nr:hypothetical protein H0H93_009696 [Arthromyces matolae]